MATNTVLFSLDGYYVAVGCDEIFADYAHLGIPDKANPAFKLNPLCASANTTVNGQVVVPLKNLGPENVGAAFQMTFGMALWIAFLIHAVVVEVYLNLTPAEGERLRMVSYERQLEAGFKYPGSAGLTVDRLGDAPRWRPSRKEDGHVVEVDHGSSGSNDGHAMEGKMNV